MLFKLFPRLRVKPLTEQLTSRDAFIYLDRGMRVVGWKPPKNKYLRWIYALWTFCTTSFGIVLLGIAMVVSYFQDLSSFTAGQFLTSLQVCIDAFGSSVKSSYTFAAVKRFKEAKEVLDRLDERCITDEQRSQLHRTVARCNRFYMAYQIMYSLYAGSTFLSGAFSGRLPWKLYNPLIDSTKSLLHFWVASFSEYMWMSTAVMQNQMADLNPIIFFLTLRTHISFLKERLRGLRTDPKTSEQDNYKELIQCIEDHHLILNFCDILRPVISATIFTQFLLCGVVIGLSMINVFFFSNFWTGLGSAIFIFDLLLETFPFCYICNMIMDDCEDLANNLFHSNWVNADPRYKTTLRYFLHNVQSPIVLTAGGVFIISLSSNITVAKLAFSVVTFVKQLNIAEKFQNK